MAKFSDVVFAIGDIHGRADLLDNLQNTIKSYCFENNIEKATVVYLGDYIDRGLNSKRVVDLLINGLPLFKKVYLAGNHEQLLLNFIENSDIALAAHWIRSGGDATLRSYDVECEGIDDFLEYPGFFKERFLELLPEEHKSFFKGLKRCFTNEKNIFVHAGLNPAVTWRKQSTQDMLWIREPFLKSKRNWGKLVVHGHTPQKYGPDLQKYRLNIDTCGYSKGTLTAAIIRGKKVDFLVSSSVRKHLILIDDLNRASKVWAKWMFEVIQSSHADEISVCMKNPQAILKWCTQYGIKVNVVDQQTIISVCADRSENLLESIEQGESVLCFTDKEQHMLFIKNLKTELGLDENSNFLSPK